jgi:hypothetical protein
LSHCFTFRGSTTRLWQGLEHLKNFRLLEFVGLAFSWAYQTAELANGVQGFLSFG